MDFSLFIAQRLIADKSQHKKISTPIVKIGYFSIALALIVMLISMATGIGLQRKIREKISGFNGQIQVLPFDSNTSLISLHPISVNESLLNTLKKNNEITHIQRFANKACIIKTENDFEGVILKGVGDDYDWHFFKEYLIEGNLPHFGTETSNEVLISKTIAQRLKVKVGNAITLWFVREDLNKPPQIRKLTVTGIFDTGYLDFDNSLIISDIRHIQKLNKWQNDEVGGLEILINDFNLIPETSAHLYKNLPSQLNTTNILEKFPYIFEWIKMFDKNIYMIIFFMILVAGFNMITALIVLILEQTQLIGILKAMGTTNWQIRKIFLNQATYIVIRGMFWGNLIGIGLLLIQKYFHLIKLDPVTYYVNVAPVYINIIYILLLNLGVLLLSYAMMLLPSYYISKISPVKAIRFE